TSSSWSVRRSASAGSRPTTVPSGTSTRTPSPRPTSAPRSDLRPRHEALARLSSGPPRRGGGRKAEGGTWGLRAAGEDRLDGGGELVEVGDALELGADDAFAVDDEDEGLGAEAPLFHGGDGLQDGLSARLRDVVRLDVDELHAVAVLVEGGLDHLVHDRAAEARDAEGRRDERDDHRLPGVEGFRDGLVEHLEGGLGLAADGGGVVHVGEGCLLR